MKKEDNYNVSKHKNFECVNTEDEFAKRRFDIIIQLKLTH